MSGMTATACGATARAAPRCSRRRQPARRYAFHVGLDVMREEPLLHNLDRIKHLLDLRYTTASRKRDTSVDCKEVLAAWNLFGDVQYSLRPTTGTRIPRRQKRLYRKVFVGNNLPSLTPPGKHYTPLWNNQERRHLRSILRDGLRLLRRTVRLAAGEQI